MWPGTVYDKAGVAYCRPHAKLGETTIAPYLGEAHGGKRGTLAKGALDEVKGGVGVYLFHLESPICQHRLF